MRADVTADRVMLPVKVNETARGEVLAAIDGDNVLIPRAFAEQLGIPLEKATTVEVEGEPYVSLSSLSPELVFKFDPDDVVLALTVDPKYLGKEVLQLRRGVTGLDRGGDPTVFLNYAFTGRDFNTASFFGEIGASREQQFFSTGFSGRKGDFVRGLTSYNVDSPLRMRRITYGDRVVGTDVLGGSATIGGVTLSREFTLQPYLIRTPALDITGTATTPSTVEIYVNGQLTSRVPVAPGTFTLRDLPVTGGLGSTRLVVRDVFGRETVQEGSFYYSTVALRKGLSEYTFSAGLQRDDLTKSFEYDEPAAYAQYRRGITDRITLGGRVEGSQDVISGGPRVTLATRLGDLDLSIAGSRTDDFSGSAGSFAYRFNAPRYSFGVSTSRRSDHYATLSLLPDIDRVTVDTNAFAAASIGWFSVGVLASRIELRDAEAFQRVAIQGNAPAGRWGNVFLSFGRVKQGDRTDPEILMGLTVGIGHSTTADVQLQRIAGQDGVRAELRKSLGTANGLGYALQTDSTTDTHFSSIQYQTSFGRYEIAGDPQHAREAFATISGGLVYIGGAFLPTRPLQDSFALARVGVPRVRVFSSNLEIGRTNRRGDLLVTNLLAHYSNELHIADKDVPMDYEVNGTNVTVVPPTRGGVLANFPVRRLQSYTGRIQMLIIGEAFAPSLGLVDVEAGGQTMSLPLGREGEFYIENLSPGTHHARLNIGVVGCNFNLVIPATDAALTDLGVISCVP